MAKYDRLLEPISIGDVELKNRFVLLPMSTELVDNYYITDPIIDFYEQRAKGGTGLLEVGSAYVCDCFDTVPQYHTTTGATGLWEDSFIPGWKKLNDACHQHGAKTAAQLQLCYEWRAKPEDEFEAVGPSEGPGGPFVKQLRELTVEEIQIMVKQYGEAAKRARDAGTDIIEIHAGIGYMVMRFLSSYSNRRTDDYGGTLEKRTRFLTDIIDEIHRTCGDDCPILVRISADDFMPDGNRIEDTLQIIPLVEKHGVDAWSVQVGFHEAPRPVANQFVPEGEFIDFAKQVKGVTSLPVFPGTRINTLDMCDKVVSQGYGDLVGMGRQFIAEPETAIKVEQGHPEQVRPCIVCSRCLDNIFVGKPVQCSVNADVANYALGDPSAPTQAAEKKHIVIIGAGPGGMETARMAAKRGHRVTLIDKSDKLGGVLNMAQVLNANLEPLVNWYDQEMRRLPIELKLGTAATPEAIKALAPDAIVVAPGGEVIEPSPAEVPGIDGKNVVSSNDIKGLVAGKAPKGKGMMWKAAVTAIKAEGGSVNFMRMGLCMSGKLGLVGKRVVIVGGGFAGLECAHAMMDGREITVVEEAKKMGNGIGIIDKNPELAILKKGGVKLMPLTKVKEITPKGARVINVEDGTESFLECDTVLYSLGVEQNHGLYEQLSGQFENVHLIGDATTEPGKVRRVLEAVADGYRLGMTL